MKEVNILNSFLGPLSQVLPRAPMVLRRLWMHTWMRCGNSALKRKSFIYTRSSHANEIILRIYNGCQFHQNSKADFSYKIVLHRVFSYNLAFQFLIGERKSAQKQLIKYWWNWHLVWIIDILLVGCLYYGCMRRRGPQQANILIWAKYIICDARAPRKYRTWNHSIQLFKIFFPWEFKLQFLYDSMTKAISLWNPYYT